MMYRYTKILELIKKSGAVRRFVQKPISDKLIKTILDAGVWGLSILGLQSWRIICVKDKETIASIANIMVEKASDLPRPLEVVTKITAEVMKITPVLIVAYNRCLISEKLKEYGPIYTEKGRLAEVQSISTALYGMHLMAYELGLGSLWVDSPSFLEKYINPILKSKGQLVACLLIGHTDTRPKRSKRAEGENRVFTI